MNRFLSHMLVASVILPALGGAVHMFNYCDWHDASLLSRLAASVVGGFVLLAFIWFFTIPMGVFTSLLCFSIYKMHIRNRVFWCFGGAVFGAFYGLFMAEVAKIAFYSTIASGYCIGAAGGIWLWKVWSVQEV